MDGYPCEQGGYLEKVLKRNLTYPQAWRVIHIPAQLIHR